jgi:hypothetical protein
LIQRSLPGRRNFLSRVFPALSLLMALGVSASAQEKGGKELLSPYGPNDRVATPPPPPTILQPYGPHAGTPIPPARPRRTSVQQPYAAPAAQPYQAPPQPYYQPAPQPQYYPPQYSYPPQPYYQPAPQPQYYPPQYSYPPYYQQPYYQPQPYYQQPYYPPQQYYQAPPQQPYYCPQPYYSPPPAPPAQLLDPYSTEERPPPAYSQKEYPYYYPPQANPVSPPTVTTSQPPRPANRLLLKLSLGYGYHYVLGTSLNTLAVELMLGSEGRRAAAGGRIGFEAGQTSGGANFEALSFGPGVEWKLGSRVRLGMAPSLSVHFIDDQQFGGTGYYFALGAWLDLSVDLIKNKRGGALYLGARAGYDWLLFSDGGSDSFVARLWLGYRF